MAYGQVNSSPQCIKCQEREVRALWELIAGRWPDLDGGRLQEHGGWVRSWWCIQGGWDEDRRGAWETQRGAESGSVDQGHGGLE